MSGYKTSQKASDEAMFRRIIRRCDLSATDKTILQTLVNLWFVHREAGQIHPGRKRLAEEANVHVNTVKRALARFRELGILFVVARPNGGGNFSTRYAVNLREVLRFCGQSFHGIENHSQVLPVDHTPVDHPRGPGADHFGPRSSDAAVLSSGDANVALRLVSGSAQ